MEVRRAGNGNHGQTQMNTDSVSHGPTVTKRVTTKQESGIATVAPLF